MVEAKFERKLSGLEEALMELAYVQQKSEIEMIKLQKEMKEFKDEMKEFKDEMGEFKDWSKSNIEWSKNQIKEMNKQWGHLANKLGTVVEDIIFPSTRPILKKYFKCDPNWLGMNIAKKKGELNGEFDVIAVCNNNVFLIEVKATPKIEYINDFIEYKVTLFKTLFDEYKNKNLILIFATLRFPENILNYLTRNKIYAMAYKEWEYMDILNFNQLSNEN